jgi:anti-sigma-K factor RskA
MRRTRALILFPLLLATACATGGGVDRALVEAGRQVRREQPPPTAADLRLEIDSFLENELPHERKRAERALARETKLWRATFATGAALGVLAATSGSIASSDGAAKPVLTGLGIAGAVVGGVVWAVRTPELRSCIAFLGSASEDVDSFRRNAIPPGEGPVGVAVWHAWIDRVAAIRSHETCRRVR